MPNMLKVVTLCSTYVYRVLQCLDVGGVQWWCVERVLLLSSDLSIQTLYFVFGSNQNGLAIFQITNFLIFVFFKHFLFSSKIMNDAFDNLLKILRYNDTFIFTKNHPITCNFNYFLHHWLLHKYWNGISGEIVISGYKMHQKLIDDTYHSI